MKLNRHQQGGTLALVVSIFAGVVLIVGFVVLNYSQLFTHQKQAQTSIDAAALACAKQLGQVTVTSSRFGKVGLIDNYGTNGLLENPVYGINTLVARTRLDMLIANKLENSTIMYLLRRDYDELTRGNGIISQLKTVVQGYGNGTATANDAAGNPLPSIQQVALDAYRVNQRNAAGRQGGIVPNITLADFRVEVGYLSGSQGNSNVPTPITDESGAAVTAQDAQVNRGTDTVSISVNGEPRDFYRAYMNIPATVGGSTLPFQFSALDAEPRIVDRGAYTANPPAVGGLANGVAPTVVRVEYRGEMVVAQTANKSQALKGKKIEVACANLGGRRVTPTAGIFRLEFPQGLPDSDSAGVNFRTVKGILDEALLPDASDGTTGPSTQVPGGHNWRGRGRYFTAQDGPFPGPAGQEGSIVPSDVGGRSQDVPSVSLAFFVYDWLRNDGLRPNINQVVAAFNTNLETINYGTTMACSDEKQRMWLEQPAYAQPALPPNCRPQDFDSDGPVFGCIFDMVPDSDSAFLPENNPRDPRALNAFSDATRNDFREQANTFRMILSAPQQAAWAGAQSMAYGIDSVTSLPQTCSPTNSQNPEANNVYNLPLLRIACGNTQAVSMATWRVAFTVNGEAVAESIRQADLAQPFLDEAARLKAEGDALPISDPRRTELEQQRQAQVALAQPHLDEQTRQNAISNRCADIITNTREMIRGANFVDANMLALTSRGLTRTTGSPSDLYTLGQAALYSEPTHVVTQAECRGTGAIGTGQNSGGPGSRNWASNSLAKSLGGNTGWVTVMRTPEGDPMFMPVYASTFGYTAMKNFRFVTIGDCSQRKNGGKVEIRVLNPGAPGNPTAYTAAVQTLLEGQRQYQALNVVQDSLTGVPRPSGTWVIKTVGGDGTSITTSSPTLPNLFVMWSMMGQDNVSNPGVQGADTRDPNSPGNQFDLDGNTNCDSNTSTCNNEAVRFQITSPLLRTDVPLDPIPLPPNGPSGPTPSGIPGPIAPPRQGH
jgi:hypothetical protein